MREKFWRGFGFNQSRGCVFGLSRRENFQVESVVCAIWTGYSDDVWVGPQVLAHFLLRLLTADICHTDPNGHQVHNSILNNSISCPNTKLASTGFVNWKRWNHIRLNRPHFKRQIRIAGLEPHLFLPRQCLPSEPVCETRGPILGQVRGRQTQPVKYQQSTVPQRCRNKTLAPQKNPSIKPNCMKNMEQALL